MLKTLTYILTLAILAFGVWFFIFKDKDLFEVNEAGFTIRNTKDIDKIFLANQKGQQITVQKTEHGWIVNDTYPAREGMIDILLETLKMQSASYPVPEEAHDNVIKSLSGNAIKVELYKKGESKIRTFYVGGQAPKESGCYMLMEGAKRPYVVQIPVFNGYVTSRYSTDILDWRSRKIFNFTPEQVQSISLNYTVDTLNNFEIVKQDGSFKAKTHPLLMDGKEQNTERVDSYVSFFNNVNCEGYLDGVNNLDSIIAYAPKRGEITIKGSNNKNQHIDIYWMYVTKRSKNLLTKDPNVSDEYDPDRMYAVFNQKNDTAIIQMRTFKKLFQKGYVFFEKE